jgi:hypothetical protein
VTVFFILPDERLSRRDGAAPGNTGSCNDTLGIANRNANPEQSSKFRETANCALTALHCVVHRLVRPLHCRSPLWRDVEPSIARLMLGGAAKGVMEAFDQRVHVERLFQNAKRSGFEQASAFLFRANRRYEDGGNTMAAGNQPVLKVASIHAGHLPIADEA